MARYVDADLLKDEILSNAVRLNHPKDLCTETTIFLIDVAPTADVVEVKHGEWEFRYEGTYHRCRCYCSVCGKHSGIGGIKENQLKPYCPNCGAKMDGGRAE